MKQCKVYRYKTFADNGSVKQRIAFGIGHLPGRKQSALYLIEPGLRGLQVRPIAYFPSEVDAELMQTIFNDWTLHHSVDVTP